MTRKEICVAVVGAGPAGIAAALQAARRGARVEVFESNPEIGRKLLVTGAGRCNITNMNARPEAYACCDTALLRPLFDEVPPGKLREILAGLGVLTFSTPDGWCYPLSESAHSVVALLCQALRHPGIHLRCGTKVVDVARRQDAFALRLDQGQTFLTDRLVLCAGGKAQPRLGAGGELFPVLEKLGHTIRPLRPALAPVTADMTGYRALQGVRQDAIARLLRESSPLGETRGNLIFTEWGLNGPAVMDLSHLIPPGQAQSLRLEVDLLNGRGEQLRDLLQKTENQESTCALLLSSFLAPKPARVILKAGGLSEHARVTDLSEDQRAKLLETATRLPFKVSGVRGFEYCQMKAGGVPLDEADPATFESRRVPGMYLAGETLDVLGPCGGYNLHFAFASGWQSGQAAAA